MRQWPWITIIFTAILALSPFGQNTFFLAFLSGEQLSQNIWQPLYLSAAGVMVASGVLEWSLRRCRAKKRRDWLHVRFVPECRLARCTSPCPLWATSGYSVGECGSRFG
jgi:hypothetical protein